MLVVLCEDVALIVDVNVDVDVVDATDIVCAQTGVVVH